MMFTKWVKCSPGSVVCYNSMGVQVGSIQPLLILFFSIFFTIVFFMVYLPSVFFIALFKGKGSTSDLSRSRRVWWLDASLLVAFFRSFFRASWWRLLLLQMVLMNLPSEYAPCSRAEATRYGWPSFPGDSPEDWTRSSRWPWGRTFLPSSSFPSLLSPECLSLSFDYNLRLDTVFHNPRPSEINREKEWIYPRRWRAAGCKCLSDIQVYGNIKIP